MQNLLARAEATVRIGLEEFPANARLPLEQGAEKKVAADLLAQKYEGYFTKAYADGYVIALDRR